jgi:hypothetical protein
VDALNEFSGEDLVENSLLLLEVFNSADLGVSGPRSRESFKANPFVSQAPEFSAISLEATGAPS